MRLEGRKVAYAVAPGFEDLEFWVPYMRLREEGADVTVVGRKRDETYESKHGCLTATTDAGAGEVNPSDFDAIVIPGGWAPDRMRRWDAMTSLVNQIYKAEKIVAMICHAGHVGISAGIVKGHACTGSAAIKDDIENAGGNWRNDAAFRDGNIVWGRVVDDIPDFCRELVSAIEEG